MKIVIDASVLILVVGLATVAPQPTQAAKQYGVDCSFPTHHKELHCPKGVHLGDRAALYDHYMDGCINYFGEELHEECENGETQRFDLNLRQPEAMVNYTESGYLKMRAPADLQQHIFDFWLDNKDQQSIETEKPRFIYANQWESPTYMVSVANITLRGAGVDLARRIWDAAKAPIEEWTGLEVHSTAIYGIRVYTEGAILTPHVDRLPLVFSAIVNVAQDVDEPWQLEFIDHYGTAVNVTMVPGDMVLYESGSLIYSRPFALKGIYFAELFIHFETTGRPLKDTSGEYLEDLDPFFPPYLRGETSWGEHWAKLHPYGWHPADMHIAAALGNLDRIQEIAATNRQLLKVRDDNGWTALHAAARFGHVELVQFLLQHGDIDIDARTGSDETGPTALNVAITYQGQDSAMVEYLESLGATDIAAGVPAGEEL